MEEKITSPEQSNIILSELMNNLPNIAKLIIQLPDGSRNENFIHHPDDAAEHEPNWHQFGIITHTAKALENYQTQTQDFLTSWQMKDNVENVLSESVDGIPKSELVKIAIILHDIGKFDRGFKEDGRPDYGGHEAKSQAIILNPSHPIHEKLISLGLSENQIKYIATCAGLHYELGKSRAAAKESEYGYTIAYAQSDACRQTCHEIAQSHPEYRYEIGLLFLGDNLGKTDVVIHAETDEDISSQTEEIAAILEERHLNPKLAAAVAQNPVNIAVAKTYFESLSA